MTEENDLSGLDFAVGMMRNAGKEGVKDALLADSEKLLRVLVANSAHCYGVDFELLNNTLIGISRVLKND